MSLVVIFWFIYNLLVVIVVIGADLPLSATFCQFFQLRCSAVDPATFSHAICCHSNLTSFSLLLKIGCMKIDGMGKLKKRGVRVPRADDRAVAWHGRSAMLIRERSITIGCRPAREALT